MPKLRKVFRGRRRTLKRPFKRKRVLRRKAGGRAVIRSTHVRLGRSALSSFPKTLSTVLRMCYQYPMSAAANGQTAYSFLLNSFGDGTAGANGCGPTVTNSWAVPFGTNYPTGNFYLLGSQQPGGGIAPYYNYVVTGSVFRVRVMPKPFDNIAAPGRLPTSEFRVTVLPAVRFDLSTMPANTLAEQPWAKTKVRATSHDLAFPAGGVVGTWVPDAPGVGIAIKATANVAGLIGVPSNKSVIRDRDYWCNANASCFTPCYWHLVVNGDSTGFYLAEFDVQIDYHVTYFNLNQLASSVNA